MSAETILKISDLDISFRTNAGVVHAIRGVDMDLQKGETVAVVGESGSGKSVTMKAVMGLLDSNAVVNSGEILYRRPGDEDAQMIDLLKIGKKQLRQDINGQHISMVFQDPMTSLDPTMPIGRQIMEGILLHKNVSQSEARRRALELLELVGINDAEKRFKNYPHQLSGGMRQRVVIAIALSADPDILICDEPTTALDVTIQAKILELIKSIQEKMKLSVIYITHDLGVVAKVADYVNVMYAGRIVEVGNVNEIFYEPCHPYTWGLLSAMPDINTDDDRLYSIPGSPPNLLHEPVGDAFADRNPFAMAIDKKAAPPMFKISETHFAATWLLSRTLLRGEAAPFVLELPPYRRPQIGKLLLRSLLDRTARVLGRAAAVAAPAGALLWLLGRVETGSGSLLTVCAGALDPLGRFFGLDGAILLAFLLGLPANETVLPILLGIYAGGGGPAGAGSLAEIGALLGQNGWTAATALCAVIFTVLHWPCSTTLLTVKKETGSWKWTALAALLPMALGLALCAAVAAIGRMI